MANTHVLGEIKRFLEQHSSGCLEITFAMLEILTFHHKKLLNRTVKKNGKLLIHAPKPKKLAQIEVLDHLVFQFSFGFPAPAHPDHYQSEALVLPRPLSKGILTIDAEKLQLEFTIDAPNQHLKVAVKHVYTHILPKNQPSPQ